MKKNLNVFLILLFLLSSTYLIGQETLPVFFIDNQIKLDLTTVGADGRGFIAQQVFPSKGPSGIEVLPYSIANNQMKRITGKRFSLQVNPKKPHVFYKMFSVDGGTSFIKEEIFFDPTNNGKFMDREGSVIIPDSRPVTGGQDVLRAPLRQATGNAAVTDENTVANSKQKPVESNKVRNTIAVRTPINNVPFTIFANVETFEDPGNIRALYKFSLVKKGNFSGDQINGFEIDDNPVFINVQIIDAKLPRLLGRGEAITNMQTVSNNIISILKECKANPNQALSKFGLENNGTPNEALLQALISGSSFNDPNIGIIGLLDPKNSFLK